MNVTFHYFNKHNFLYNISMWDYYYYNFEHFNTTKVLIKLHYFIYIYIIFNIKKYAYGDTLFNAPPASN